MDGKMEPPNEMREKWMKELKMTMSQDRMKSILKREKIVVEHAPKIEPKFGTLAKVVESQIRKIEDNERSSFKRGMELEWVQLCPHCDMWVGRLVEHMKCSS